jgi:hypothetical protein
MAFSGLNEMGVFLVLTPMASHHDMILTTEDMNSWFSCHALSLESSII